MILSVFALWHYSFFKGNVQVSIHPIRSKNLATDFINCWLRYTLAQPVDFDIHALRYFLMQYVGIFKAVALVTQLRSCASFSKNQYNQELVLEVEASNTFQ